MASADSKRGRAPGQARESGAVHELELEPHAEPPQDLDQAARDALAAVESAAAGEETSDDEVGKLQQENADLRDRSIRTLADFDNFRKRAERERDQMRR